MAWDVEQEADYDPMNRKGGKMEARRKLLKSLGLKIPQSLLIMADKVIE